MVDKRCCIHHLAKHPLVARCSNNNVGHTAKAGEVENTVVRGTILANDTCTIEAQNHRQALQRHIVDDIVVGTLHKR